MVPPAFRAGFEPPANKFLFDAVKTPDHVSLQDGENPEKNTRKEGGSCPGTPRGSGPELLDGLGLGGSAPAPPGAPRQLPVPSTPLLVPPRCFLEAEISPALEINVSVSREPPAPLHFFLVRVFAELPRALLPSAGDVLAAQAAGSSGLGWR